MRWIRLKTAREETEEMPDELIRIKFVLKTLLADGKDDSFEIGVKRIKTFALEELEKPVVLGIIDILSDVGLDAVKRTLESQTKLVIEALGEIGERAVKKELYEAIEYITDSLGEITVKGVESGWCDIVKLSLNIVGDIYVKAGEKRILRTGNEAPISVITIDIWHIVEAAIKKGPVFATDCVAKPLKEFCIKAIDMAVNTLSGENFDQVLINISFKIAGGIAYIGEKAIEKEDRVIEDVVRYLAEIGAELAKAENMNYIESGEEDISFKHSRSITTVHLSKITDKSTNKGEKYVKNWVITPLANFGLDLYSKYTFEIEFNRNIVSTHKRIEELPIKDQRRLEVEYRWIMSCLEEIGLKIANKQLDSATKWLIKSIIGSSENHKINGLNSAPKHAAQSLVKIATKGRKEDMVENIFEEHFKSIEASPENTKAFKELKEIYENELKK